LQNKNKTKQSKQKTTTKNRKSFVGQNILRVLIKKTAKYVLSSKEGH
jgi:hypothetical protein